MRQSERFVLLIEKLCFLEILQPVFAHIVDKLGI